MTSTPKTVPLKTWLAVIGSTLGSFMAVLNIQITNTALPYIEGGTATVGFMARGSRPLT